MKNIKTVLTAIDDIIYSAEVIELISLQVKKFGLIETGGTLLGFIRDNILHVSKASGPGPKAIHEPDYFRADANYIDMFIDMEVANSNDRLRYVGEWHTHPQVKPVPSPTDFKSLTEIAESSNDFVLMLIVGALKFEQEYFTDRHIAIIKHKDDVHFYKY